MTTCAHRNRLWILCSANQRPPGPDSAACVRFLTSLTVSSRSIILASLTLIRGGSRVFLTIYSNAWKVRGHIVPVPYSDAILYLYFLAYTIFKAGKYG
jgi:hypothetical protein